MRIFAQENKCYLTTEGECGFGRPCVGVLHGEIYPDYDPEDERLCAPEGVEAYHKHNCIAVLGRGEQAIDGLYRWLLKLKQHKAKLVVKPREFCNDSRDGRILEALIHGTTTPAFVIE